MKRKLITGERIMYADAATPVNCVFAVKIRGGLTLEGLRVALRKVQAKHAMLRVGIREDRAGMPWFVSNDPVPEIPVQVVERQSAEDWASISKVEWKKRFDVEQGPLARVVWVRSETVSELILVCAHCICDGTTLINLMQEILLLLDQPEKAIGEDEACQGIDDLVPSELLTDRRKVLKARIFSVLARIYLALSLPGKSRISPPYMIRWKLGKEESAAIFARCRAEHVSFHAVLSVAFLTAFRQVKGKAHNKIICPVDIRRYIKQLKSDTMFAFAPVIELSLSKDPATDFWANAKKLRKDLSEKVRKLNVLEQIMLREYLHASVKKIVKLLKSTKGTHDVTFSNLGRINIQKSYRSFELEDVYCPSIAFPWRNSNTAAVSVFRGQMDFALLSNDGFLPYQEAEAIKEKTIEILLKEATKYQTPDTIAFK